MFQPEPLMPSRSLSLSENFLQMAIENVEAQNIRLQTLRVCFSSLPFNYMTV